MVIAIFCLTAIFIAAIGAGDVAREAVSLPSASLESRLKDLSLSSLPPSNDWVSSNDSFAYLGIVPTSGTVMYLEPENVSASSGPIGTWSIGGDVPYLFQRDGAPSPPKPVCSVMSKAPGHDSPGNDIASAPSTGSDACGAACCENTACAGFVFVTSAPSDFGSCKRGQACCYLKSALAAQIPSSVPGIMVGVVTPRSPYDGFKTPPNGMRSAVPLGGISAGAVELRADGQLHEWTIVNQSPGGAAKVQRYPSAFFGARVGDGPARALQTHPDASLRAPGVEKMSYTGAYPASRLQVQDPAFGEIIDLFAFSALKVNDMEYSSRPAAVFSLRVGTGASFFFQLPIAIEPDQKRSKESPSGSSVETATPFDCKHLCDANATCTSWSFVESTSECFANTDAYYNNLFAPGISSGVPSQWIVDESRSCLIMERRGSSAASGSLALCASFEGSDGKTNDFTFGYGTSDDAYSLFSSFAADGMVNETLEGAIGAISVTSKVPGTLSITFGWHFRNRDH